MEQLQKQRDQRAPSSNSTPEFQNVKHTNHQDMTKVFQFLQKKKGITAGYSTFSMEGVETNVLIWRMIMSSLMKAAIHPGPNSLANLEVYKNTDFEEVESLFNITQKLILEHSGEILNVKSLESSTSSWTRSVLSHDQAIKWTKTKVRVHSDSVICGGQMNESKEAIKRWEGQVEEFKMYPSYKELLGIDGEAIELELNIFPGFSSLQILQEIQGDMKRKRIEFEEFTDRIMFMSMFNDIDWTKERK